MTDYRDAEQAPPWRSDSGTPAPTVTVYAPLDRPMMRVRLDSVWRTALVLARFDHANGRTSYHVEATLPTRLHNGDHAEESHGFDLYWDPRAMRPLSDRTPYPPWS